MSSIPQCPSGSEVAQDESARLGVLFLCVSDSARSQIAEGLARQMFGVRAACWSAGSQPSHVHPSAVEVMREVGIDLASHTSKPVDTIERSAPSSKRLRRLSHGYGPRARREPRDIGDDVLTSATDLEVRPLTKLFRALGDETRLRIVALLAHGELCVCHLEKALDLTQPNASRQLGILKSSGVVDSRREGTWVYYSIVPQQHDDVEHMLAALTKLFGTERTLRVDHAKLRKSCGPNACK